MCVINIALGVRKIAEVSQPTTGTSIPKKRPTGVTILAILLILGAILNAVSVPTSIYAYGVLYGGYTALVAVLGFIIAIGLWQLLPWARKLAIAWYIIGMTIGVLLTLWIASLMGPMYFSIMMFASVPSWIVQIIVIIYLMQASVKAAFEGGTW